MDFEVEGAKISDTRIDTQDESALHIAVDIPSMCYSDLVKKQISRFWKV